MIAAWVVDAREGVIFAAGCFSTVVVLELTVRVMSWRERRQVRDQRKDRSR